MATATQLHATIAALPPTCGIKSTVMLCAACATITRKRLPFVLYKSMRK